MTIGGFSSSSVGCSLVWCNLCSFLSLTHALSIFGSACHDPSWNVYVFGSRICRVRTIVRLLDGLDSVVVASVLVSPLLSCCSLSGLSSQVLPDAGSYEYILPVASSEYTFFPDGVRRDVRSSGLNQVDGSSSFCLYNLPVASSVYISDPVSVRKNWLCFDIKVSMCNVTAVRCGARCGRQTLLFLFCSPSRLRRMTSNSFPPFL